jgi:hypothetical protein
LEEVIRRTREHIIADLSVNYLERVVLRCGYTLERRWVDYGYDAMMTTYTDAGEPESGVIQFQLKATDSLNLLSDGSIIAVRLQVRHIRLWLSEVLPVILVVYDAATDTAYWLYLQRFFQQSSHRISTRQTTFTVHLQTSNRIDEAAIRQFREIKLAIHRQLAGVVSHG